MNKVTMVNVAAKLVVQISMKKGTLDKSGFVDWLHSLAKADRLRRRWLKALDSLRNALVQH